MPVDKFGVLLDSEHPDAVISIVLHLSRLRTNYLVGRALAEKYPTEAEWQAVLNNPATLELIDEFAQTVVDVRVASELAGTFTPDKVQEAVGKHYDRALDGVQAFAQLTDIAPEDLLSALTHA